MGQVVLAEHRNLKKIVCVKLLHAELTGDAGLVERFRVEAQALAVLGGGQHKHLVHVRDYGVTPAGQPFLVMEALSGRTLSEERQARGKIPWREACTWTVQALAGVAAAHQAGVVHRDLKPANLFLCSEEGESWVKVLDFGIAKIISPTAPIEAAAIPTGTGIMVGTPRYASPEQIKAEPVDGRADVYSLALVLHELITGDVPYPELRASQDLLLAQVFEDLPRTSDAGAVAIPNALDDVIAKATKKDPAKRFESATEFAEALNAILVLDATQVSATHSAEPQAPELAPTPIGPPDVGATEQTEVAAPWFTIRAAPSLALGSRLPVPVARSGKRVSKKTVLFVGAVLASALLFLAVGMVVLGVLLR